jgi:hypothetical protein
MERIAQSIIDTLAFLLGVDQESVTLTLEAARHVVQQHRTRDGDTRREG